MNANYDHYIMTVHSYEQGEGTPREVLSRYYDGTRAAALRHFRALPEYAQYADRDDYLIVMRGNGAVLADNRTHETVRKVLRGVRL